MSYVLLKSLHILIASLLFGLAVGSNGWLYLSFQSDDLTRMQITVQRVLTLNFCLIMPLGMAQALLGFSIISVKHYQLQTLWVWMTLLGFIMLSGGWLCVTYQQLQCRNLLSLGRDTRELSAAMRALVAALACCGVVLVVMFYCMSNRPI